jgi:hypothetical protein
VLRSWWRVRDRQMRRRRRCLQDLPARLHVQQESVLPEGRTRLRTRQLRRLLLALRRRLRLLHERLRRHALRPKRRELSGVRNVAWRAVRVEREWARRVLPGDSAALLSFDLRRLLLRPDLRDRRARHRVRLARQGVRRLLRVGAHVLRGRVRQLDVPPRVDDSKTRVHHTR